MINIVLLCCLDAGVVGSGRGKTATKTAEDEDEEPCIWQEVLADHSDEEEVDALEELGEDFPDVLAEFRAKP